MTFTGCSSAEARQSVNYLPKAFEALIEEVDSYIEVESVKYISGRYGYYGDVDYSNYECSYFILFKYENSSIERYAKVIVSESTSFDGYVTDVDIYSSEEILDDQYDFVVAEFEYAKNEGSGYYGKVDFKTGTLNNWQISNALKDLQ